MIRRRDAGEIVQLEGLRFDFVGEIHPERSPDGSIAEFLPQEHYAEVATEHLSRHGRGPFCKFTLDGAPTGAGIYLVVVDDTVVYVGECHNLAERFGPRGYGSIEPKNCYSEGQSTKCRVNHNVLVASQADQRVELWFSDDEQRKRAEDRIMTHLHPPWNAR
ncbi:MAG: hypothetical protein BMS9Abin07_0306 [Acidimicrobiia bacterium]|nr:MAG: hypothetical protein BMS9Abin07_0306 [Acidimicrobiia bacterium]